MRKYLTRKIANIYVSVFGVIYSFGDWFIDRKYISQYMSFFRQYYDKDCQNLCQNHWVSSSGDYYLLLQNHLPILSVNSSCLKQYFNIHLPTRIIYDINISKQWIQKLSIELIKDESNSKTSMLEFYKKKTSRKNNFQKISPAFMLASLVILYSIGA